VADCTLAIVLWIALSQDVAPATVLDDHDEREKYAKLPKGPRAADIQMLPCAQLLKPRRPTLDRLLKSHIRVQCEALFEAVSVSALRKGVEQYNTVNILTTQGGATGRQGQRLVEYELNPPDALGSAAECLVHPALDGSTTVLVQFCSHVLNKSSLCLIQHLRVARCVEKPADSRYIVYALQNIRSGRSHSWLAHSSWQCISMLKSEQTLLDCVSAKA
jgi:hypothetical protein